MTTIGFSKVGLGLCVALAVSAPSTDADAKRRKTLKTLKKAPPSALRSANVEEAIAAATALGTSTSPQAMGELLDALAMGLHPRVASAALDAVALRAKQDSFDVVSFYMHHRSAKVRSSALKVMGALGDKRAKAMVLGGLGDGHKKVRAAAAEILAAKKEKKAIEPLMSLLKKGDEAPALALAALANPDLARAVSELIGTAPDGLLARCLGAILMRPDFKPEEARVEVVKALGKIPGNDSLEQLTNYVGAIPEKPPRDSRSEAERIIEARLGGI
ncbi:MAG: hypothetical protein GY811_05150 [Myxococcales bacterium]|nr:hypothetical protein [Myxococcales bacterium]